MNVTRWGIIGPGKIAEVFANDLDQLNSSQQVQAILGHTRETAERFAKEFNVPQIFYDIDEFLNEAKVDIVYVATPHTLHYEQVLACLNRKIPVLCEKPLTINRENCEELIRVSQQNNVFLMEGMWIRFLPSIKLVLDLLEQ